MANKRNMIFRDLARRPSTVKELAGKFGIAPATVRKHISLLRAEGRKIAYDSGDRKYYTPQAKEREERIRNSIKRLAEEWNPYAPRPERSVDDEGVEAQISSIFKDLITRLEEVEKRASELVLRCLLLNTDIPCRSTLGAIGAYLGLEDDVVQDTVRMLVRERILSEVPREEGEPWYRIDGKEGFVKANSEGYLSITPREVLEVLTIRETDVRKFSTEGAPVHAWCDVEGSKKIRWIPAMVHEYFIPGIQEAFIKSMSKKSYKSPKGANVSGLGLWDLMPPVVLQLADVKRPEDDGLGPEWSLVNAVLDGTANPRALRTPTSSVPSVDPFLWKLLGFLEEPSDQEIRRAEKRRKEAELRYLLAYYRGLRETLDREGMAHLQKLCTKPTDPTNGFSPQEKGQEEPSQTRPASQLEPGCSWVVSCFLAMLSIVFQHARAVAERYGLSASLSKALDDYHRAFANVAR